MVNEQEGNKPHMVEIKKKITSVQTEINNNYNTY